MDEILFIFKGIDINDREYVLKLEEHGQQTDVIALNEEYLPMLNDDAALRLLKVLADTIKADLADKAK
jgi:outer membrane protein assembly factor BamC